MSKEILCDFFLFLSTDKTLITQSNWIDFDIFIEKEMNSPSSSLNPKTKSPSKTLFKSMHFLWLDLLYFMYKNDKSITISAKHEAQIASKINLWMREKTTDTNSYQSQYLRNIDIKKAKVKETKQVLIKLLRSKEVVVTIDPAMYIAFFNKGNNIYKERVTRFMKVIKPIIEEGEKRTEEDNKTWDEGDKSHSDWDKSNENNKSGLSCISNKDDLISNKEQFLEVWNKVKRNINKVNEGGENNNNNKIPSVKGCQKEGGNEDNYNNHKGNNNNNNNKVSWKDVNIEIDKANTVKRANNNMNVSKQNNQQCWDRNNSGSVNTKCKTVEERKDDGEQSNCNEGDNDKRIGNNKNKRKKDEGNCGCGCGIF